VHIHISGCVGWVFDFLNKHMFQFFLISDSEKHQFGVWGKSELKNCQFWLFQNPQRTILLQELVDCWVIVWFFSKKWKLWIYIMTGYLIFLRTAIMNLKNRPDTQREFDAVSKTCFYNLLARLCSFCKFWIVHLHEEVDYCN
jgi:hypothetical protein